MSESLDLEINLSSMWWDKPPRVKVWLNNNVIFRGLIESPTSIKHTASLTEGNHVLRISLSEKNGRTQTIVEDGKIIKDQILNIDNIIMDDIDLGHLIYTNSKFVADLGSEHHNMINLGLNGTWYMPFQTPIYVWLLENL